MARTQAPQMPGTNPVDVADEADAAGAAPPAAAADPAPTPVPPKTAAEIDPTTLKRSVLTDDGWICPQPPLAKV